MKACKFKPTVRDMTIDPEEEFDTDGQNTRTLQTLEPVSLRTQSDKERLAEEADNRVVQTELDDWRYAIREEFTLE
ncbi:MAG: hypothetical protein PHN33_06250 [Candidatus Peribacteraceae bacterium]|nr:hypothetical protein [Candidatus Peribacteraceae bacterium]